jgi:PilZ domain
VNMRFFNRRRFPRRTAHEVVWIEKEPTILERCTLVNVSETGARLTISDVYDLPESFALHLTRESNDGRRCQIIWRRDHEVGVEFLSERPLGQNTPQSHLKDGLRPWRSRKLMTAIRGVSSVLSASMVAITNLVPRYRSSTGPDVTASRP